MIEEYWGIDYDWFLCDELGNIGMFNSAGGSIPDYIINSLKGHLEISQYVQELKDIPNDIQLNPNLQSIVGVMDDVEMERYLSYFRLFAERGVFVYDRSDLVNLFEEKYHLVLSPMLTTLNIKDIPPDLAALIKKGSVDFSNTDIIYTDKLSIDGESSR